MDEWIVVLSDGETYSTLDNKCVLLVPTKEGFEALDNGGDPSGFTGSQYHKKLKIRDVLDHYIKTHR